MPMSDLKQLAESCGLDDVATYVQSGNLVFAAGKPAATPETVPESASAPRSASASASSEEGELSEVLRAAIADRFDVSVPVVVVSRDRLDRIVAANPFPEQTDTPKCLHVLFHQAPPGKERSLAVAEAQTKAQAKGSSDQAAVVEGVALYLHTPDGLGRSDLAALLTRAGGAGGDATARNWSTVIKLVELLSA